MPAAYDETNEQHGDILQRGCDWPRLVKSLPAIAAIMIGKSRLAVVFANMAAPSANPPIQIATGVAFRFSTDAHRDTAPL
jgi:hypothetical protein